VRIGSLFGIQITVNVSWIFIFALVAWSLANPLGPLQLQGVGATERVALGITGSLLFFVSVLLHELAHSLLARSRGIKVRGITLFIFGGVSQFDGEASDAPGEAWISGIGPLTSLVLGALFYGLAQAVGPASHVGVMFLYLGAVNVVLAIFNFLPAYPLDGGRVLHALVWKATGNRRTATRVSVTVGRIFAALMIAWGVVETLTLNAFGGLWITFIGWYLLQAGNAEQTSAAVAEALSGHQAAELIAPPELRLTADVTAERALQTMQHNKASALPVYVGEQLLGVVSLVELVHLPPGERPNTYVTAAMTRLDSLPTAPATVPARDVLIQLAGSGVEAVVVTKPSGDVQGIVTRESVMRWLAGHAGASIPPLATSAPSGVAT
jgi:Zn-dependent protease/predicted transcriptional regulator